MLLFQSAQIRIAIWYVAIVFIICSAFSIFIYKTVTISLEHSFEAAELRLRAKSNDPFFAVLPTARPFVVLLIDDLNEAKKEVALRLVVIDVFILLFSAVAGYILGGKTLQPIELAVNEQKRFVSDASHELRTPLTSLKAEIEVALRDRKLSLKDAKALIKSNLEEVDKMQHLTNYLLACSRYGNSTTELPFEKFKVTKIVDGAVKKVTPLATKKGIKLVVDAESFDIRGNLASLEELLVILLDNGIKYSDKGKKIFLKVKLNKSIAIFEIIDHGIGIKASDVPYIFNRFYRADVSRSKEHVDGYGLGLAIAKSIVEVHKGEIKVKSQINEGTTFKVMLPV